MTSPYPPSKNVLAVLGLLCVNKTFRSQLFTQPFATVRPTIEAWTGPLTDDEVTQMTDLSGYGALPPNTSRQVYQDKIGKASDALFDACTCPDPPCPAPFA
jgi:hypothetical protein